MYNTQKKIFNTLLSVGFKNQNNIFKTEKKMFKKKRFWKRKKEKFILLKKKKSTLKIFIDWEVGTINTKKI